jgi:hypothetical protein
VYLFPDIKDTDIAKYIVGSSYLGKEDLDLKSIVGIHQDIQSQKVFVKEMMMDVGWPQIKITEHLAHESAKEIEKVFEVIGLKEPYFNLKQDPNFIVDYKKHDLHLEFRESIEKR